MASALTDIQPVDRKETLGAIVRDRLRASLMAGRFRPGEKLTIRAVASALEVSLTPAREALYNLVAEGVLDFSSAGTALVPNLDRVQIAEIGKIRTALEGLAASEACTLISDAQILEIERIQADLVVADAAKDYSSLIQLNWQFHFAIYSAADMPALTRLIENCWLRIGSYLNVMYPSYGDTTAGVQQHEIIVAALRSRDRDALRGAVQTDIRLATAYLMERSTD